MDEACNRTLCEDFDTNEEDNCGGALGMEICVGSPLISQKEEGAEVPCSDVLCQIDVALDDAIILHASEFCSEEQVGAARKRISEAGGTLAYFAGMKELIKKLA